MSELRTTFRRLVGLRNAVGSWGDEHPIVTLGLSVVGLVIAIDIALIAASDDFAFDTHAYWNATYTTGANHVDAFIYAPPMLLLMQAIHSAVPFHDFLLAYSVLIAIGVWLLSGPFTALVVFTPWVAAEITLGNIHVFLALIAVAGFRWPWLWAFSLLTKVTSGVGILWFPFRGEWRKLAIVVAATLVIAIPTIVVFPGLWVEWIQLLVASGGESVTGFGVPLVIRLPIAVALVWIGARTDQRWLVPLASMLALPVLWSVHGLSMLLGVLWYLRGGQRIAPRLRRPALVPVAA